MYNIKYLINKDLVNREAINLIFKLNNLKDIQEEIVEKLDNILFT